MSMSGYNRLFNKRVKNELKLIQKDPLENIDIYPDEADIKIWYFLICGPDDSDYKNGWYIGKLILSENYPATPVDFYMLTPNGRFEIEKKICLTISSYHSGEWSAIWSIRTILGAFLSIMTSDYDSGISHIKQSKEERKILANNSHNYNIKNLGLILTNFPRFVKHIDNTIIMKSSEEIKAEMPVSKKSNKKADVDMSMIKLTD